MAGWTSFPITQGYNPPTEYGVDIGTPFHTPITNLYSGKVVQEDYAPWGGEVGIQTNLPGVGTVTEYFQHLDQIASNIIVGAQVSVGQLIGLSGGQNVGGSHPVSTQYSSGPHTEFGFDASWISPSGPNFDPTQYLSGTGGSSSSSGGSNTSTVAQELGGLCVVVPALCNQTGANAISAANSGGSVVDALFGPNWQTQLQGAAIQTGLVIFGAVAILLGLYIFVKDQ